MFLTAKHISRRTALRGLGVTVALPFLDAMVPARAVFAKTQPRASPPHATGLHRAGARRRRLQRVWAGAESLESRRDRPPLRSQQGQPEPARAVPQSSDHRQQHRRADGGGDVGARSGRRPFPIERGDVHPRASEVDRGVGRQGRHLDGPVVRPEVRPGHADSLDAAQHRAGRSVRRLRLRIRVRLHRHDQLGRPGPAAADGARSAHGVRAAVRIRRHAGAARTAARDRSQHPRHADDADGRPAAVAGTGRPAASGSVRHATFARSSSASRASKPATRAARRASCPERRRACRIRSRNTSS